MTHDTDIHPARPGTGVSFRSTANPIVRAALLAALLGLLLALVGCAGKDTRDVGDLSGYPKLDPDAIADAVPRVEPRSRYGNMESYEVDGRRYFTKRDSRGHVERGVASWYGKPFVGRPTSSRETYDMLAMTAAHRSLPLPTYVRVTNLENGRSAVVRINDRGPFHESRIIDLSYAAAVKLGVFPKGSAQVEIRAIDPASPDIGGGFFARETEPEPGFSGALEPYLEPAPNGPVVDSGAIVQSLAIARRGSIGGRTGPVATPVSTRERAFETAMAAIDSGEAPDSSWTVLPESVRPEFDRPPAPLTTQVRPPSRPAKIPARPSAAGAKVATSSIPKVAPKADAKAPKVASKADAKAPKVASAKTAGGAGVFLQVGAFGDPKNAEDLRRRLSSRLGTAVRVQKPTNGAGSLYKVRVGPLAPDEAKKVTAKLASLGVKQSKSVPN